MGDIYKNAECVHAWLGLSTKAIVDAMLLLKGLEAAIDPAKFEALRKVYGDELSADEAEISIDETSEDEIAEDETSDDITPEKELSHGEKMMDNEETDDDVGWRIVKLFIEDADHREKWVALFDIYNRPYWKRLWIVQEYLLGKRTLIHIGLCVIDDLVFAKIRKEVGFYCMSSPLSKATAVPLGLVDGPDNPMNSFLLSSKKLVHYKSDHQPLGLLDALKGHRLQLYSEPRDIVYALLGLCDAITQKSFPVDYSIELGELFKRTAWYIIESSKSLDILKECHEKSDCYCCKDQIPLLDLPSWVPDWRCRATIRGLEGISTSALSWPREGRAEASLRREVLSCRGLLLEAIDTLLSPAPDDQTDHFAMFKAVFNFVINVLDGLNLPQESENVRRVHKMAYRSVISGGRPSFLGYITAKDFTTLIMGSSDGRFLLEYVAKFSEKKKRAIHALGLCLHGLSLFTCTMILPPSPRPENVLDALVLGVCVKSLRKGDNIAILYGCKGAMTLRTDVLAPGLVKVLGPVYLPSYSAGKVLGDFEERDFELS
ncbi:hypothetical protein ACEPPN_002386 [Leptodophora sp. 'Broadleaf-Isolate-01']